MIADLTQTQRRALAISLLVMAAVVCYLLLIQPPIEAYRDLQQNIEQLQERLLRFREIGAQRATHEEDVQQLKLRQPMQTYFLKSETDTLAGAELQDYVKTVISDSGGELVSMRVLPAGGFGRFSSVSMQVQMTGKMETVLLVFYALESGQPFAVIDDVYLHPKRRSTRRRPIIEDQLDIRFELTGFKRAKAS